MVRCRRWHRYSRRHLQRTKSWDAFLVGLAASAGAGISMGFAEALSDDGSLTGRGHPWVRGVICGAMTALGGIGHTLPFLDSRFSHGAVGRGRSGARGVGRDHLDTQALYGYALDLGRTAGGLGGVLVFITGMLIGSS
jgi:erythrin-vacuolar iron transport family protein